jgi:hypothetical protein
MDSMALFLSAVNGAICPITNLFTQTGKHYAHLSIDTGCNPSGVGLQKQTHL